MDRTIFDEEHDHFRAMVRSFIAEEVVPFHDDWETAGIVPKEVWKKAGAQGLLCTDVPTEYGGGGVPDFRYNAIVDEEISRAGTSGVGFGLHNDVIVPYLQKYASDEQKARWFPPMASGRRSPPWGSASPGPARTWRDPDHGRHRRRRLRDRRRQDVHHQRDPRRLLDPAGEDRPGRQLRRGQPGPVPDGHAGFSVGRKLKKLGIKASDTAELHFDGLPDPAPLPARRRGPGLLLPDAGTSRASGWWWPSPWPPPRELSRTPCLRQRAGGLRPPAPQVPARRFHTFAK